MISTWPEFWAYVGGFLDGEGSICTGVSFRRESSGRLVAHHNTHISLFQHHRARQVLDYIQSGLGYGKVRDKDKSRCCLLSISGRPNLVHFLTNVGGYLIVKRQQAEWMLQVCRLLDEAMTRPCNFRNGDRRLTKEEMLFLVEISAKMNSYGQEKRLYGRSLESMVALVNELYAQGEAVSFDKMGSFRCEQCGKEFQREKCRLKNRTHIFCSLACANEWSKTSALTLYYADFTCAECGKTQRRPKSKLVEGENFCTLKCANRYRKKKQKEQEGWEDPFSAIHKDPPPLQIVLPITG